jgi:SH3 domain protein
MIVLFIFIHDADASRLFIKDSLEITLRTGPSVDNKIIGILRTGDAVEILETSGNWSRVKQLNKNKNLEGWVLGRYLMERVPWELQVVGLKKENARLLAKLSEYKESLDEISKREKGLSTDFQKTTSELKKVKGEYEELKNSSKNFITLKKAHEEALSNLELLKKRNKVLEEESKNTESNQRLKWFGTGAMVLLIGLIMGIVMGRKEKKRKSLYY